MSVSGHSSLAQAQVYIEEVEQGRMAEAAMEKLTAKKRTQRLANLGAWVSQIGS